MGSYEKTDGLGNASGDGIWDPRIGDTGTLVHFDPSDGLWLARFDANSNGRRSRPMWIRVEAPTDDD